MDIPVGNFTDEDIKEVNKEFNRIIKELIMNNEVFKKFYPAINDIKIGFENLLKGIAGYAEKKDRIAFNTSIYDRLKEVFMKLRNKIPLTDADMISMNFFTHEFLHTTDDYPYPAIAPIDIMLSEGLREMVSWQYTSAFLGKFYNKESGYFFDILANNSPIYKDITDILKPIFDRFKDKEIFYKVDEILTSNCHNNIFKDMVEIITEMSSKEIGVSIMKSVKKQLKNILRRT